MLDLAFLIIGIYVIAKANNGVYKETACNAGIVVGLLAAIVGSVVAFSNSDARFAFLNIIVAVLAFLLPSAARHLVKLYDDKQAEVLEQYERESRLRSRGQYDRILTGYDDDNFDDEELRFGKGGFTDPKM